MSESRSHYTLFITYSFLLLFVFYAVHMSTADNDTDSSLIEYSETENIIIYWDVPYNSGLLVKGTKVVSFNIDLPFILVNFQEQYRIDPLKKNENGLYITKFTKNVFEDVFSGIESFPFSRANVEDIYEFKEDDSSKYTDSRVVMVILDPGHGGKDLGAVGRISYKKKKHKVQEKDVVLDVSLLVNKYLTKNFPNLKIVLTRDSDEYLSLEERIILANEYLSVLKDGELMLFISVHANAALNATANGYEIWHLPPEYTRKDLVSQGTENSYLYPILNNLRDSEITLESIELAKSVLLSMESALDRSFINRGIKENEWYVVRNTKMPAILIELGFVSHPKEGYLLLQESHQDRLAKSIAKGIEQYLELFDVSQIR